ncbi:hypothetical protein [Arenimonas fontis]|uniref:Uncharacterized protein n=1 Tax=Arenimonas fontis TaxID=2608255 RepID=A0A5B2ZAL9_9GAMM|nr:hypothetical protein [Arenimonas fontis]KAA2284171.1 hypothetical protein F0415_10510 [Arenimonas fontis]
MTGTDRLPTQRTVSLHGWILPAFALAAGVLGVAALWVAAGLGLAAMCGWMAPVAALDMALMLRLAAMAPGRARAWLSLAGTALAILVSTWLLAAAQFGVLLGLAPWESASRIGPSLVWELLRYGSGPWDWTFVLLALPLAWRLGR